MKTIRKLLSLFLVLTLLCSLGAAVFAAGDATPADLSVSEEAAAEDASPADLSASEEAAAEEGSSSGSFLTVLLCVLGGILVLGFAVVLIVKKFSDAN